MRPFLIGLTVLVLPLVLTFLLATMKLGMLLSISVLAAFSVLGVLLVYMANYIEKINFLWSIALIFLAMTFAVTSVHLHNEETLGSTYKAKYGEVDGMIKYHGLIEEYGHNWLVLKANTVRKLPNIANKVLAFVSVAFFPAEEMFGVGFVFVMMFLFWNYGKNKDGKYLRDVGSGSTSSFMATVGNQVKIIPLVNIILPRGMPGALFVAGFIFYIGSSLYSVVLIMLEKTNA